MNAYTVLPCQRMLGAATRELGAYVLRRLHGPRPRVLNFLANDICNSRCEMCMIWQRKKDYELTPDDFARTLSDPLFKQLHSIGVSGGEPTLRKDLPELFAAAISARPRLRNMGLITNAIQRDRVRDSVLACRDQCRNGGVDFSLMISLDGVGDVHDTVRGRSGNYDSALELLRYFTHETDIPTSFGCTITRSNAEHVGDLLDLVREEGFYGRFRVAEFIDRLYNSDASRGCIRSFDDLLRYHLGLFFHEIEHTFETQDIFKKTYRNIREMVAQGKPRQIGCPYQERDAVLTSRGELLYCSPKSRSLGVTLQDSALALYRGGERERQRIRREHCDQCIHDYHEPVTFVEWARHYRYAWNRLFRYRYRHVRPRSIIQPDKAVRHALIVGWYGTETAGDKAILWSVLKHLRRHYQQLERVTVASLHPFVTRWTLGELQAGDVQVVQTYTTDFERACDAADLVVFGGGPLMDVDELDHATYAFARARQRGAHAVLEGVGLGPLREQRSKLFVDQLANLATEIRVRDRGSLALLNQMCPQVQASVTGDPAATYVQDVMVELRTHAEPQRAGVCCFLRDWPEVYRGDRTRAEFIADKSVWDAQVIRLLIHAHKVFGGPIRLLPMHCFHVGGDDRVYARRVERGIADHDASIECVVPRLPVAPDQLLSAMRSSRHSLCMRYHSVLFADVAGQPFTAIDYTGGGKVAGYLRDRGRSDRMISDEQLMSGTWERRARELFRPEADGSAATPLDRGGVC